MAKVEFANPDISVIDPNNTTGDDGDGVKKTVVPKTVITLNQFVPSHEAFKERASSLSEKYKTRGKIGKQAKAAVDVAGSEHEENDGEDDHVLSEVVDTITAHVKKEVGDPEGYVLQNEREQDAEMKASSCSSTPRSSTPLAALTSPPAKCPLQMKACPKESNPPSEGHSGLDVADGFHECTRWVGDGE